MILSVSGMIISMALFIFLSMRKWNVALISIFAGLVLMIFNGINPISGFPNEFSAGMGSFASKWWIMFSLGAVFGKVMQDTGISEKIALILVTKLKCNAVLAVLIISLVMSYGGISTFVIAFTIYPIARELFKKDNIDESLMPAVMLFCPTTLAMTMLPGTPSVQNIIPTTYLKTDIYAAPFIGLFASSITFILGYIYFKNKSKMCCSKDNSMIRISEINTSDFICFAPCICLWILSFILISSDMESQTAVEISLVCGIILSILIGRKKDKIIDNLNEGIQNGLKTLIITSFVMGYGNLVKSMPAFSYITYKLYSLFDNEMISSIIAVNIIAALTGSSTTSLQLLFDAFSDKLIASSLSAGSVHRIIAIASGGLDSMPYATGVVVANNLAGTAQSKTYKHVFITCAVIPLISLAISMIACCLI